MRNVANRKLLGLALGGVIAAAWISPSAVHADGQLAQTAGEGDAAGIAREIELGDEKARQDDKQDARDAREQTQKDIRRQGAIERDASAGEAAQRRSQRRSRFRAILEK